MADEEPSRRRELWFELAKVLLGTTIVGIAVAAFPFAQKLAELRFTEAIRSAEIAAETAARESQQLTERVRATREFLASVGGEARDEDINRRIVVAEYFAFLAPEEEERRRWSAFRDHLYATRERENNRLLQIAVEQAATQDDGERTRLEYQREQIVRGLNPTAAQALPPPPAATDKDAARREAARLLASGGPAAMPGLFAVVADPATGVERRTGVVIALTEAMRGLKAQRREIASTLDEQALTALMLAAGDVRRDLRIHAAEFLFDLGDPRAIDIGLALWRDAGPDARFNYAMIAEGAAADVPAAEAARVRAALEALRDPEGAPRAAERLDRALRLLPG